MKLDVTCFRYLTKEDFRVMEAIELGMRNHELVPIELIGSLAKLRHGGIHRFLSNILRYKLVAHANAEYNGYRLSYLGYDILALHTLMLRGVISSVGSQIGVGKESDIFEAQDENGNDIVLKIHRLGRTSFRSVRRNRDYMMGKNKASWLYMSRLAAIKEFVFMKALYANGFPTPVPIDQNRHVVAMSRIHGFPLAQIKSGRMEGADAVFRTCVDILHRLAKHGLVHCDFNEFNLMVDEDANVTLIDFPQMVSISHINASELYQRDLNGLVKFFAMKMHYQPPDQYLLSLQEIIGDGIRLDEQVKASGWSEEEDFHLIDYFEKNVDQSIDQDDTQVRDQGESSECYRDQEEEGREEEDESHEILISNEENKISVSSSSTNIKHSTEEVAGDITKEDKKAATSNDDDDDDHDDDSEVRMDPNLQDQITNRAKRHVQSKFKKNTTHSRNMTKKRNKYGKIDRNFRNFDSFI